MNEDGPPNTNKPNSQSLLPKTALVTLLVIIGIATYEALKQLFFPDITLWQSHVVTIAFSAIVSTAAAYLALQRYRSIHRALQANYDTLTTRVEERTVALQREIDERKRVEAALRESETRYRQLVELSPDSISVWNADQMLFINRAGVALSGAQDPGALVGKNFFDMLPPEMQANVRQNMQRMLDTGQPNTPNALRFTRLDGSPGYIETVSAPIQYQGEPAILTIARDISERKKAEDALREAHKQLDATLNALPDLLFELDRHGRIYEFRAPDPELLFDAPQAFLGQTVKDVLPSQAAEIIIASIQQAATTSHHTGEVYTLDTPAGQRWFELSITVKGETTEPESRFIALARDVTEHLQTEQTLHNYARQQAIIAQMGQLALSGTDLDTLCDQAALLIVKTLGIEYCKILKLLPKGDALLLKAGVGWHEGLVGHKTIGTETDSQAGFTLLTNKPVVVEDLRTETRFSGPALLHEHHVISGISVIIAGQASPFGILGAHTNQRRHFTQDDVNFVQAIANVLAQAIKQKQAEQALQESEQKFRTLFERTANPILMIDTAGNYIDCNAAASKILECTRDALLTKNIADFAPGQGQVLENHLPLWERGGTIETEYDINGQIKVLDMTITPVNWQGQRVILGVGTDITERQRAARKLRQRNRELELLNRASHAFLSTLELDQVLATVMEQARSLLDVTACSTWLVDPQTGAVVCQQASGPRQEIVRGWRLGPDQGYVGWVVRTGESLIVPDAQSDARHFKGVDQQTGLTLRAILSIPLQVKQKIIGVLQMVDTQANRFSDDDLGLLESLAATAAIAIENAQLYEQARRDAQTKTVLLREVNHRVKNNLSAIIGLLYAERRHAGIENRARYQSIINELANRIQSLATVHSMLSASEWVPLRLDALTRQVIRSSLQTLPRDKHIDVDVQPCAVHVTSDQAHNLALVINELATNVTKYALQARPKAQITVHISRQDDIVRYEFRDDGPGYPPDVLRLERSRVGFNLIQNIVHSSLRGELELCNDQGAVALIQFKAKVNVKDEEKP